MPKAKTYNSLEEYREQIGEYQEGYVNEEQLEDLLTKWHDKVRLHNILVKCGSGRFYCPMQDVNHWIKIIERESSDYVRSIEVMQVENLGR